MFPCITVKSYAGTFEPSCSMPRGDAMQLDHFCSGNYILKCGDMLSSIFMSLYLWYFGLFALTLRTQNLRRVRVSMRDGCLISRLAPPCRTQSSHFVATTRLWVQVTTFLCVCDGQTGVWVPGGSVSSSLYVKQLPSHFTPCETGMCIYNVKIRQEELIKLTFLMDFWKQLQSSRAVPAAAQFWFWNSSVCHFRSWWMKMDPKSYC